MTIHQLSIFIENKNGTLGKVLNVLSDAGIQIIASTIADTVEYGIYRLICNKPVQAFRLLKEAGLSVTMSDVFAIELDNTPGQAARVVDIFSQNGINLCYLYSFLFNGKGILVFRVDNTDKAREVISLNNLPFISEDNLSDVV